eukprot:SAG11_NODE_193_length_12862_cov_7.128888_14_plen_40_part_00
MHFFGEVRGRWLQNNLDPTSRSELSVCICESPWMHSCPF